MRLANRTIVEIALAVVIDSYISLRDLVMIWEGEKLTSEWGSKGNRKIECVELEARSVHAAKYTPLSEINGCNATVKTESRIIGR